MSLQASRDQVLQVFKTFDTNGDGTISLKELRDFLSALGVNEFFLKKKTVQSLFELINTDKGELITFDEFFEWWEFMAKTSFVDLEQNLTGIANLHHYFEKFDKDHTGQLDQQEFRRLYDELGLQNTKPVEEYIQTLDVDGDNAITYREIAKHLEYI
jgi:Ca2+-binding EF-hand superfamily protein